MYSFCRANKACQIETNLNEKELTNLEPFNAIITIKQSLQQQCTKSINNEFF